MKLVWPAWLATVQLPHRPLPAGCWHHLAGDSWYPPSGLPRNTDLRIMRTRRKLVAL
jgi:hypothetical protein